MDFAKIIDQDPEVQKSWNKFMWALLSDSELVKNLQLRNALEIRVARFDVKILEAELEAELEKAKARIQAAKAETKAAQVEMEKAKARAAQVEMEKAEAELFNIIEKTKSNAQFKEFTAELEKAKVREAELEKAQAQAEKQLQVFRMFTKGLALTDIAEFTGLSIDEINTILGK